MKERSIIFSNATNNFYKKSDICHGITIHTWKDRENGKWKNLNSKYIGIYYKKHKNVSFNPCKWSYKSMLGNKFVYE